MKREVPLKLLFELIKNSKRSDRDLAKILGVSQPTVTRMRKRLEKNKFIDEYTVIPGWEKLGFEILAFTFIGVSARTPDVADKARKWTMKYPNVVLASFGEGMGMDGIMVSIHRDFTEFSNLMSEFREQWAGFYKEVQCFVVSLRAGEQTVKPFSLRYLTDLKTVPPIR